MNIFKTAYKIVRTDSSEIYKGFGFKHHSDATQYYVHPNNQSFKGTTFLCQPIGEAIVLFSLLCASVRNGTDAVKGDYFTDDDGASAYIWIDIPADWRKQKVVEPGLYSYRGYLTDDVISIGAYNAAGHFMDSDGENLQEYYKLLPCFLVLLARECRTDPDFNALLMDFADGPAADVFVNLMKIFIRHTNSMSIRSAMKISTGWIRKKCSLSAKAIR